MKILLGPDNAKSRMVAAWDEARFLLSQGKRVRVTVEEYEPRRSDIQSDKMWAMLRDISRQVQWYGQTLSPEDFKHIFTSSIRGLRVVPNMGGTGFVALGLSTSRMTKSELSELIELMYAFGAEKDVVWTKEIDYA